MKNNNKVVVFIGGYGYLAKGIVEGLLINDFSVYVLGRDESKYEKVYNNNKAKGINLNFIKCDANSSEEIKSSFKRVIKREGSIDVLVNGTYGVRGSNPTAIKDEDWSYSIEHSLNSIHKAIREIVPYFSEAKKGKIINISSMYGVVAPEFDIYKESPNFLNPPHYGVAKAGVIQLTKYFASYLGKQNITVNTVSPGPFPTEEVQKNEIFIDKLKSKTCLNRIGKPSDLAGIFVLLCSESSNYITGQNFIIDGGWTIK